MSKMWTRCIRMGARQRGPLRIKKGPGIGPGRKQDDGRVDNVSNLDPRWGEVGKVS